MKAVEALALVGGHVDEELLLVQSDREHPALAPSRPFPRSDGPGSGSGLAIQGDPGRGLVADSREMPGGQACVLPAEDSEAPVARPRSADG